MEIIVYVDEEIYAFLKKKREVGYKASSYVKFLIREQIKKERLADKNDAN